ncbi:MAG: hypothetical protein JXQ73_24025 [Phycisphaerae bacterium]|nr:hypothetical protein [Phycisphaerae bacterium]
MLRQSVLAAVGVVMLAAAAPVEGGNFASAVVDTGFCDNTPDYWPAMGQFVNNPQFNDPNQAVGAPVGGGAYAPDNSKVVSLGGFGGRIILAFDHDVEDNPANPLGLDAIVFGNAIWVSHDPNAHWTEPAIIEIMPELNGNDVPGDDPNERWYLIPGSSLDPNSFNTALWDPNGSYNPLMQYPSEAFFPNRPDSYTTEGYEVPMAYRTLAGIAAVLVNPNIEDDDPNNDDEEGFWGYAEYSPTGKRGDRNGDGDVSGYGDDANMPAGLFYTIPDNPFKVGWTRGAGGGDAFDIRWAVDPCNGWQPAGLAQFRYVRLTNAVNVEHGFLGEASPEIGGVSDVRPLGDLDGDQDVDDEDYAVFLNAWDTEPCEPNAWNSAADIDVDESYDVDLADYGLFLRGLQLFNGLAEPNEPDPNALLVITAQLLEGNFDPGEEFAVIRVSANHTGTGPAYRWFNGLRAQAKLGGGVWVDPNDVGVLEVVQACGTLTPGTPPSAVQINTEIEAATAQENWEIHGGGGQAVEYNMDRDTWIYEAFANLLDTPGPDAAGGWTFTATQFPNGVSDRSEMLHLVIRKKAGYDGSPARVYIGGQWGTVGESPELRFAGLLAAADPNAEGDTRVAVLTIEPLATCTLNLSIVNDRYGAILVEPNEPNGPPYAFPYTTQVTLTAMPVEGKSFNRWVIFDPNYPGDANYGAVETNTVLCLSMDRDIEVEASFKCGSGMEPLLPPLLVGMTVLIRRRQ